MYTAVASVASWTHDSKQEDAMSVKFSTVLLSVILICEQQ